MGRFKQMLLFLPLVLLIKQSSTFELQDTIHALIEENIHLHDQLENLTQALRELKRMLWHHANDENHNDHHSDRHEGDRHMWTEWSTHGITAETHLLLEHALCGHDPHNSGSIHVLTPFLLLLLALLNITLLMSASI